MREDPRQARTRRALTDALLRLLENAPLDDITVTRLCREAAVHRTTFYGHADGVHAFAVSVVSRDLDELSRVDVLSRSEAPTDSAARYFGALTAMLTHIAVERQLYRPLFASASRGALRSALEQRLRHRVVLALEVFAREGAPDVPHGGAGEETAAFIAGGLVGVVEVWSGESDEDAAAAARRILRLMPPWWPLHET